MTNKTKKQLPTQCPSCSHGLHVVRLECDTCKTAVEGNYLLPLLTRLDLEEQDLMLNFLKNSGSLKEVARIYGISYPTMRNRIDALINKVQYLENLTSYQESAP